MTTRPNVFNFRTALSFVKAVFEYEKSTRSAFSVRKWAVVIDVPPKLLMDVFTGKKRISHGLQERLENHLGLNAQERKYFTILVRLDRAESVNERQGLEMLLAELGQLQGTRAYVEDQSVFSHWVHMAIISICKLPGFHCTTDTICDFLRDQVSQEQIEQAVERLLGLGLVEQDVTGRLLHIHSHTTSKNDAFKQSQHDYFNQVSDLAKRGALEDAEEREFQCFSIAIGHGDLPAFKEMIRSFRGKLGAYAEGRSRDQVYQMNIQFFPLTAVCPATPSSTTDLTQEVNRVSN